MIFYYLICGSLIPKKIDNLFVYLLPIWISPSVNYLFIYFIQFLLVIFLLLTTHPLLVIGLISSPSLWFGF